MKEKKEFRYNVELYFDIISNIFTEQGEEMPISEFKDRLAKMNVQSKFENILLGINRAGNILQTKNRRRGCRGGGEIQLRVTPEEALQLIMDYKPCRRNHGKKGCSHTLNKWEKLGMVYYIRHQLASKTDGKYFNPIQIKQALEAYAPVKEGINFLDLPYWELKEQDERLRNVTAKSLGEPVVALIADHTEKPSPIPATRGFSYVQLVTLAERIVDTCKNLKDMDVREINQRVKNLVDCGLSPQEGMEILNKHKEIHQERYLSLEQLLGEGK